MVHRVWCEASIIIKVQAALYCILTINHISHNACSLKYDKVLEKVNDLCLMMYVLVIHFDVL